MRTANNSANVTPVLRSKSPRNEERGQRRHSGRSVSLIGEEGEKERGVYYVTDISLFHPNMANYFSNHSASRFLANSTPTTTTAQPATQQPTAPSIKARVPSSKHFSTTVSTTQIADTAAASTPASAVVAQVHPLRNTYVRTISCQRLPLF